MHTPIPATQWTQHSLGEQLWPLLQVPGDHLVCPASPQGASFPGSASESPACFQFRLWPWESLMGERRLFHFRNPRETGHRIETLGEIAGQPRLCGPLPFQHPYLSSISNPVPRAHGPQLAPWKPVLLWVHRLALRLTRLLSQQAEVITTAGAHKHRAESRRGRSHLHRPAANHPSSLTDQLPITPFPSPSLTFKTLLRRGGGESSARVKSCPLGLRDTMKAPKTYFIEQHVPVTPARRRLGQGCKLEGSFLAI